MPTFLFSIQRSWTVGTKAVQNERQVLYLRVTHSKSSTYIPRDIQHTISTTLLREFQPPFLDLRKEYEIKIFWKHGTEKNT
jgi:hypothetical protein